MGSQDGIRNTSLRTVPTDFAVIQWYRVIKALLAMLLNVTTLHIG